MKKNILLSTFSAPTFVFAAGIDSLLGTVLGWLNALIPIAFALALLLFFVAIAKFVLAAGDSGAQEAGRNLMIWGVVAMFVMASVFGLVTFLQVTLGVDNTNVPNQPTIEFTG